MTYIDSKRSGTGRDIVNKGYHMTQIKLAPKTKTQTKLSKTLRVLALSASAAVLAACATATPYQAASAPGAFDGFSQTMIENDRARVTFGGNSLTDRETVENYLLYRAAELAVERGFDNFTLQQRDTEAKKRVSVSPGFNSFGYGAFGPYDPYFNYSFFRPNFGWSRAHRFSRFHGARSARFGGFNRGFGFGGRLGYDPFFNDYDVREITKYRASAEVKFARGVKPDDVNSFNAKEVLQNLSSAITYPEIKT